MTWTASELPYTVHYAPDALEEARRAASCSYLSNPPGRFGIGGVLLGHHTETDVCIERSVFFDFRHVDGVGFKLSEDDRARLTELLAAAAKTADAQPVGWFRSVNGELSFTQSDQALHLRFFPERWQMLLLLKPHKLEPTRATFYFLNCGAALRVGRTHEFRLPEAPRPVMPHIRQGAPFASMAEFQASELSAAAARSIEAPPLPAHSANGDSDPAANKSNAATETAQITLAEREDHPDVSANPEDESDSTDPRDELDRRVAQNRRLRRVALISVVAVAILGGAAVAVQRRGIWLANLPATKAPTVAALPAASPQDTPPPQSIRLVTIEENGQLQILWDPTVPVIQHSPGGALRITDGGDSQTFALEPTQIQTGSFTYARQSQRVDVILSINQLGAEPVVQATTYVGRAGLRLSPAIPATATDDSTSNMTRLKAEALAERRRADRLQQVLDRTRRELDRQRRSVRTSDAR